MVLEGHKKNKGAASPGAGYPEPDAPRLRKSLLSLHHDWRLRCRYTKCSGGTDAERPPAIPLENPQERPRAQRAAQCALRRFTPLARGTKRMKRTRIRRRSKKAEAQQDARDACRDTVLARCRHRCEWPGCHADAIHVHERLPRVRGGDPTDPDICAGLCKPHHDLCHLEDERAYAVGLMLHSWDAEAVAYLARKGRAA